MLAPLALENLKSNQRQLDADGCEVGVSRQALEELIAACEALSTATPPDVADAVQRLCQNLASFDAEVASELLSEGERADLWTEIDVNADDLRAVLTALRLSAGGGEKGPEARLANEILDELVRARTKFPGKNVAFAALVEEVGELATATFEESRDRVRKEAVQVAVMAMRMVLDGDHTFDDWRATKGLDALTASPTVEAGQKNWGQWERAQQEKERGQ